MKIDQRIFEAHQKCLHEIQDYFEYRSKSAEDKRAVTDALERLHAKCKEIKEEKKRD